MLNHDFSHVLGVCRDRNLGVTRQMVLQTRFAATTVFDLAEVETLHSSFDVIILCHSLSQEECIRTCALCRFYWPEAQVLALAASDKGCSPGTYDQVLVGMTEPVSLLNKVSTMLHSKPGAYSWHSQSKRSALR